MTPSARIKIIQEIATYLAHESYALIDLLLRQFGLPWRDNWGGNTFGYVMAMMEEGSDEQLSAVADHLEILHPKTEAIEVDCWEAGYFKLFLSHTSAHSEFASSLQAHLTNFAISTFVAHIDIEPTREWQDEIENALVTSDALAAFMTPDFHESDWTDQEIGIAIGRGVLVVPIRVGLDPYGFIGKYQALQGYNKDSQTLAYELFNLLLRNENLKYRLINAIVEKFVNSNSFKEANDTSKLLLNLRTLLNREQIDKIKNAVQANNQVGGAIKVPALIGALDRLQL